MKVSNHLPLMVATAEGMQTPSTALNLQAIVSPRATSHAGVGSRFFGQALHGLRNSPSLLTILSRGGIGRTEL
ncbi:MAG: hypothetical protein GW893_11355 [Armatimonadetes bacterium]|nr:hypothetical protein [Armatimonadota bacterium]